MKDTLERILARIQIGPEFDGDPCWLFQGATSESGHGVVGDDGRRTRRAHRVVYERLVGPIPPRRVLHHRCEVPQCVNPSHLLAMTQREHILLHDNVPTRNAAKTHCLRGHELPAARPGAARECGECARDNHRRWISEHREQRRAYMREYRREWKSRRRQAATAVVALALSVLGTAAAACAAPRPNILLVVLDDARADEIRFLPTVQDLAARGTSYQRTFAAYSLCAPSRASILSGNGPARTGVRDNHGRDFDPTSTIAVWLHDTGYATGLAGQYLNKGPGSGWPKPPGWDFWRPTRTHSDYGREWPTILGGHAAEFIESAGPNPWFLYLAPTAPHGPVPGPEGVCDGPFPPLPQPPNFDFALLGSTLETKRWPQRLSSLCGIDILIRGVVSVLEERGELDNTVIVVTSDQGYSLGERGEIGKMTLFEEVVRVPLVIAGPSFGAGSSNRIVSLIDIAPTVAEVAGAHAPEIEGRSILSGEERRFAPIEAGDCSGKRRAHSKVTWCGDVTRYFNLLTDPYEMAPASEAH